jgi:hypothetical protein
MLSIEPGYFPGFQGLYYYFRPSDGWGLTGIEYFYLIDDIIYNAENFSRVNMSIDELLADGKVLPSFDIDPNGSQILGIDIEYSIMLYQKHSDGTFRKLLENPDVYTDRYGGSSYKIKILRIPSQDNQEIPLEWFMFPSLISHNLTAFPNPPNNHDRILQTLNEIDIPTTRDNYLKWGNNQLVLSPENYYETLQQIYNTLPEYLMINGLKVNFVSFQEISEMLTSNKIERYIIDPILQPWVNGVPPYYIFTFFGKNGMTYLAKARYDPVTNKIFF